MTTEIVIPAAIPEKRLTQVLDLIVQGGKIKRAGLKAKIMRAKWIAYLINEEQVICTVTLKSPSAAYTSKIFKETNVKTDIDFDKELGYASTDQAFEGQGHCQTLLQCFMKYLTDYRIYAITKEPAMVHILKKLKFGPIGEPYQGNFQLLTYPSLPYGYSRKYNDAMQF